MGEFVTVGPASALRRSGPDIEAVSFRPRFDHEYEPRGHSIPPGDQVPQRDGKLWEDHITWTRMFIVSSVAELPDKNTVAGRLLAIQDDIGDAIKPYYGKAADKQLSSPLKDHILIAAELLDGAKGGNAGAIEDANASWHDNAREIADFLHAANKANWPRSEMRSMMVEHLEWTLAEAVARLNPDWASDVKAYDRIHRDILHMADMLSNGIINQFPARF